MPQFSSDHFIYFLTEIKIFYMRNLDMNAASVTDINISHQGHTTATKKQSTVQVAGKIKFQ